MEKKIKFKTLKVFTLIFLVNLCWFSFTNAQEVLKLEDGHLPGNGKLEQIDWLTGYWKGTGLGGECDEIWMPGIDNSMAGVFRFVNDSKIQFTEYMVIEEQGESLAIKLKHFNRDLSPWEEKDNWVEFKLIKIEGHTAYFDGLTYHRQENILTISLSLSSKDKFWVEKFRFEKVTQ
ncbi:hypothetical protein SAMN00777080_2457 [Aquiflexum balticum DSM 16537]|uniref:DUF6265 domain-containing protein n=1 Tax=Aquiflexum balticum DSM 16537 TaxID=758820 RepID=A0A1W2H4I7_9BACT|nr:DUF6265 family protein [Aquiflexum balticum]SMD43845.1 hypothetical protein SAMN00777080_2457 [Aquiflexum balticum DSM 16537]